MKKITLTNILAIFILCQTNLLAQKSNYKIIDRILVEGDGGWDYLTFDESSNRLFISHSTVVQVLDLTTKKIIRTIPNTKGVHGITLANDLNKGFISNGKDTSVTVINLKTLETLTKVKVTGLNPDAILYDKFSNKVFVFNGHSKNVTVINAKTNEVISTITLEGKPEFSVSDEKGKVFVNIEDKNSIAVIDTKNMTVEQTWVIVPGEEPTGLAIDNKTHRLFSVCGNKLLMILNSEDGKMITSLPIGDGCDGVSFDEGLKIIYAANGDGTMTVVKEENENSFKVLENVQTQSGARTITIDPKTHHIFLPTAEFEPTPQPTSENPKPRAKMIQGTFAVMVIAPVTSSTDKK